MNDPVFIVTDGSKTYRIWADGQVEGFDISPQIIINRIPQLVDEIERLRTVLKECAADLLAYSEQ